MSGETVYSRARVGGRGPRCCSPAPSSRVEVAMERLDDTDERILAELAEDARATYADIGQRVNLSAPAVKRRVDRIPSRKSRISHVSWN